MFWAFLIIGIVGYIIYSFLKDRDQMLTRQVDRHGGMATKYSHLIERLTSDPSAKVVKVTRDHIHIRAVGTATATNFLITENFNSVEVEWVGQLAMLGTHKKKWSFPHNYPQDKMIEEMERYMEWKTQQMFGTNL